MQWHECNKHNYRCINDSLKFLFPYENQGVTKLNPEKCVFGVQRGKVLGCLVSVKGIEANLDKINAIVHMKPLGSRNEV
jgi:hypothetical protein